MNFCSFKGKSHLSEPPPISDIVLAVATLCANNSLACQLLYPPQWEAGKRKKAGARGSAFHLPPAQGLLPSGAKHTWMFFSSFFNLFFLKGSFWRAAHRRAVFSVKCSPSITRPLVTSPCWMKSLTELQEDKPAFQRINQVHQQQSCWPLDGHAGSVGSAAPGSDAG